DPAEEVLELQLVQLRREELGELEGDVCVLAGIVATAFELYFGEGDLVLALPQELFVADGPVVEVLQRQAVEAVLPAPRIEEVARHQGVEVQPPQLNSRPPENQ